MATPTVTIIGLGKVGTAWLNVLPNVGYPVISAYSRTGVDSSLKKNHSQSHFGKEIPNTKEELGQLIFLTVSDDAIESVSETLAKNFPRLDETFVIHCSGVLSSEALSALKKKGAKTASFHPIKAITKKNNSFKGTWFDMEGDEGLLDELEILCQKLGAHSFLIKPEAKPHLHASAVVASNYLVVLADLVKKISAEGEILEETALKSLIPLMRNTLDNIEEFGTVQALTGPVARGDVQTIERHLEGLKSDDSLLSLYKKFGKATVDIAEEKSGRTEALNKIRDLFS
ncbi:MAG: Rossmann-like and DUF2520 domain-containing protein [Balneolaceae bacterium]